MVNGILQLNHRSGLDIMREITCNILWEELGYNSKDMNLIGGTFYNYIIRSKNEASIKFSNFNIFLDLRRNESLKVKDLTDIIFRCIDKMSMNNGLTSTQSIIMNAVNTVMSLSSNCTGIK